jgi:hypothetical protein
LFFHLNKYLKLSKIISKIKKENIIFVLAVSKYVEFLETRGKLKLIARIVITGLLERVEGGDRNDY